MTPRVERARDLAREAEKRAPEFEAARRMPADFAAKLADAGLMRMLVPAAYGGGQASPRELAEVLETLAYGDAATGWVVMIAATTGSVAAALPERHAEAIYGRDTNVVTVGVTAPFGRAVEQGEDLVVEGHWPFASGCHLATWIAGGCQILDETGAPRLLEDGRPDIRLVMFDHEQVEILDTWNAIGLRGTGSTDFEVHAARVPADRAIVLGASARRFDAPLYRFPLFGLLALGVASVGLGAARRSIDELIALAANKKPTASRRRLADQSRVQAHVGAAEAQLRAARALVFEAIDAAWDIAVAGQRLTTEHRRDLRLAATHAAHAAADVANAMYRVAGGTSVYAGSPLQRCFRDVHTLTQHVMVQEPTLQTVGRLLLGMKTDVAAL